MNKIIPPLALLCLPVLPAPLAHAAFSSAIVAADSRWMVHLDFNALRESAPGKKLLAAVNAAQPGMANGTVKLDMQKVLAAVGSLTAFGSNFSQDPKAIDGSMIIQGTPDLRKIAEGLIAEATVSHPENVAELKGLPFEAYSLSGGKSAGDFLIVGFPKEPIILVGKSQPHLERAYAVFQGKAPSLKGASSPLNDLIPKDNDAYLLAASVIPSEDVFTKNAPQARVLQMASSGSIAMGENKTLTYVHLKLVSPSDEMADKLMKIIQGMTAMLSLAETSDKQLEEFAKSVTVERHDKAVHLSLAYSTERIAQMIDTLQEGHHRPSPAAPAVEEKSITSWTADQKLGTGPRGAERLVTRTIENVKLSTGSTVILSARRGGNDAARIDFVEIVGQQPGATPLHFEAEALKFNGYRQDSAPYASGGKLIALNNQGGSARLQFPGVDGVYTVKVCYLDDPDGSATFTLATRDPEPVVHE